MSSPVHHEELQQRKDQFGPDKFRLESPPSSFTRGFNRGKTSPVQTIVVQKVLTPSITRSCNIGKTSPVQTIAVQKILPHPS
ncbi:hypothetical protein TNCV_4009201 [Trichonephila clavipes]|nr:hypothetical protein TNCV_4009201 [Trichonephila clavipes]